ncbi:MAG TPA: ABC transporter permease [bacterium]|nr:ABC transporter permease [bacterium]
MRKRWANIGSSLRAGAGRLGELIVEELRFLRTQPLVLFIALLLPVFYPPVISTIYYRDQAQERPALLIDADNSELSRKLTSMLEATQGLQLVKRLGSLDDGYEAIKRREAELLLFIPPDFSTRIKQGQTTDIKMWMNASNMYAYSLSYPAVLGAVTTLNAMIGVSFFYTQGMPTALAKQRVMPINQDLRYAYHPTASYGNFLVTGVWVIVMQQLMLIVFGFSIGTRKELGRYDYANKRPFAYLAGKFVAQSVFFLLAMIVILFVVQPAFHWTLRGAFSALLMLIAFMIAWMPVVVVIGHFCRDRWTPFQVLMFFSTPALMFSGFAWPLDKMPLFVQAIAALFPATPTLLGIRLAQMKTASFAPLLPYCGWLAVQFVVYFALAVLIVRRSGPKPYPHEKPTV